MNLTCPCCHAKYSLDAALESEAAGELQVLLAQAGPLARPLIAYLGMFRSKTRALSFDRAVRLAREVLEIPGDQRALGVALAETVESLRAKRDAGDVRPLTKHNYLLRVLESTTALPAGRTEAISRKGASRTLLADQVLEEWAGNDWLRIEISHGLLALLALPLYKSPDGATIDRTASLWERELRKGKIVLVEGIDRPRVQKGFSVLLSKVKDKFPEPSMLYDLLPRRPAQAALEAETEISEEVIEEGRQVLRSFFSKE